MKPRYILTPYGPVTRHELEERKAYEMAFTQRRYRKYPSAIAALHVVAIEAEYDYFLARFAQPAKKPSRGEVREITDARRAGLAAGKKAMNQRPGPARAESDAKT